MKLGLIQDVKVPLKVVLGETEKISLRDVAGIGEGTIIELDRLCGEPVDLVAAGEVIAKGEVVVIDENFGIRVTEIMEKEAGE
jgi:flagellar motor switch protein FliN/FliY